MKTIDEVMQEVLGENYSNSGMIHAYNVVEMMRRYASEVLDQWAYQNFTEDQSYYSSGEPWCRVRVESIDEMKLKIQG